MGYQEYAVKCLSNPFLIDLLPDKKVFRIRASKGFKVPYCTYRFYDKKTSYSAEGKAKKIKHYIQIDINSHSDFTNIEKAILKIAAENEWEPGATYEDEEPETGLLFKCMRFSFDVDYEEE